jgi:hypothetical protein
MSGKSIALVVGGTGMAANGILPHLLNDHSDEFSAVICLALAVDEKTFASRTSKKYIPLSCNLNDKAAVVAALQKIGSPKITHIYWYAEANRPPKLASAVMWRRLLAVADGFAPVLHGLLKVSPQSVHDQLYGTVAYLAGSGRNERNQIWMGNVLDACKATGCSLKNFMLGCGGKHYGMHLGPSLWSGYSCPFDEDKTRCPGPLSYFDAEQFIMERAKQDKFSWNVVRPTFIIGLCPELTLATQSFGIALSVYALVIKAQGKNLMYPGSVKSFNARINLVTSEKIAEVAVWSSLTHPNEAYNCVSCPSFSWREAWPAIAAYFGMQPLDPVHPLQGENTALMMGEDAPLIWGHLQKKYGLVQHDFACLLNNDFLDKSFMAGFDSVFSVDKLKRHGYAEDRIYEYENAVDCMTTFFDRLVDEKVIPSPDDVISGLYSVDVKKRVETDLTPAFIKGRQQAASTIEETQKALEKSSQVEKVVEKDITSGNVLTLVNELSKLAEEEKAALAKSGGESEML